MPSSHVLCVPRDDADGQTVLVHVVNKGAADAPDLEIEGTDGELPYFAQFSPRALSSLADPETLQSLFLQRGAAAAHLTAAASASALTLTVHAGSAQGVLSLAAAPARELDTLAWTAAAAQRASDLAAQLGGAERRAGAEAAAADAARADLASARDEHALAEDKMLRGFVAVLNAKKARVRQLLKALAAARVGDGAGGGDELKVKGEDEGGAEAKRPRAGKRKAEAQEGSASESDGSAFEDMRAFSRQGSEDDDEDGEEPPGEVLVRRGIGKVGGVGKVGGGLGKIGGVGGKAAGGGGIGKIGGAKGKAAEKERPATKAAEEEDPPQATKPAAPTAASRRSPRQPAAAQAAASDSDSDSESDAFEAAAPPPPKQPSRVEVPPVRELPFGARPRASGADPPQNVATASSEQEASGEQADGDESTTDDDEL